MARHITTDIVIKGEKIEKIAAGTRHFGCRAARRRVSRVASVAAELMESRTLLSVNSVFSAGTLSVVSDADDAVAVAASSGQVTVNGQPIGVAASTVTTLNVTGGPLANQIDLTGVSQSTFTSLNSQILNFRCLYPKTRKPA